MQQTTCSGQHATQPTERVDRTRPRAAPERSLRGSERQRRRRMGRKVRRGEDGRGGAGRGGEGGKGRGGAGRGADISKMNSDSHVEVEVLLLAGAARDLNHIRGHAHQSSPGRLVVLVSALLLAPAFDHREARYDHIAARPLPPKAARCKMRISKRGERERCTRIPSVRERICLGQKGRAVRGGEGERLRVADRADFVDVVFVTELVELGVHSGQQIDHLRTVWP